MCTTIIRITFILYNTRACKASHDGFIVPAQCCRKLHTIYGTATETFIKCNAVYHNPYYKQENAAVKSWLCSVMGSTAHLRLSFEFLTNVFESYFF